MPKDVVAKLKSLVRRHKWQSKFKRALQAAQDQVVANKIRTFPQIDPKSRRCIIKPDELGSY